ncbi:class I SAM-dependent methyltransferase [Rhizomicrobium electricum]|uniref:Class I SAM-dependent methyltransferase n=1 Tax=Rhizomicrobium electricum TaxID=480070 RepID=A0ABN1ECI7_9PROT|nr:class I SAM-dependent methyltransferase [Rhizomicrobium electricum]NIJ48232.1 SAM-dependent methyltransferase [Rhizomicrobium electricum]
MYETLKAFVERPAPFSAYTTPDLWTDEYVSARMLEFHLDPACDLASRRPEAIDALVKWLETHVGLAGKKVTDLGCGPGLYAERMAMHGARITGFDFSQRSLAHARRQAGAKKLAIEYQLGDYLKDALPEGQNLVTLIYCDYCVLSPTQRAALLKRIHAMLRPGGHFLFDVASRPEFGQVEEGFVCERRLMNGFWAEGDYFGFKITHRYEDQYLALDRYQIVEPKRTREIYNWLQYFMPDEIDAELGAAGFETAEVFDISSGGKWITKSAPFGVLARKK